MVRENIWRHKIGQVKSTRGKVHKYSGMTLDFRSPGKVKIDMRDYVKKMVKDFPEEFDHEDVVNPAMSKLFQVSPQSKQLNKQNSEIFHTFVAKGLFLSKRARPDINPTIPFLCTRVQASTSKDWNKLKRLLLFLKTTKEDVLTLSADNTHIVKWEVDASYVVHPDMKGHTGATMTLGKGAITSLPNKQKSIPEA